ncbi:MAG: potassium channel family protein [Roseiflexus sp.]
MEHKIERLSQHVIVCGYGRVGQETCRRLKPHGTSFLVVDNNPEQVAQIEADGFLALRGDASDDVVLVKAGVARARALVTAAQSDAVNVYITLSARAQSISFDHCARSDD